MSTKTQTDTLNGFLKPGEQINWVGTRAMTARTGTAGLSGSGVLLTRGTTVTLTQQFIDANLGWLKLLGDEEGQEEKWGEVRFRPGAWPEGQIATIPGKRDHEEAREAARQAAWREEDPGARRVLLAQVQATYGPAPTTSLEIASYRGGSR